MQCSKDVHLRSSTGSRVEVQARERGTRALKAYFLCGQCAKSSKCCWCGKGTANNAKKYHIISEEKKHFYVDAAAMKSVQPSVTKHHVPYIGEKVCHPACWRRLQDAVKAAESASEVSPDLQPTGTHPAPTATTQEGAPTGTSVAPVDPDVGCAELTARRSSGADCRPDSGGSRTGGGFSPTKKPRVSGSSISTPTTVLMEPTPDSGSGSSGSGSSGSGGSGSNTNGSGSSSSGSRDGWDGEWHGNGEEKEKEKAKRKRTDITQVTVQINGDMGAVVSRDEEKAAWSILGRILHQQKKHKEKSTRAIISLSGPSGGTPLTLAKVAVARKDKPGGEAMRKQTASAMDVITRPPAEALPNVPRG